MSDENKSPKKKKKKGKMTFGKGVKIFILSLIIIGIVGGGIAAGSVISILKDVPEIDPTNINDTLNQTSTIYNQNGDLIEKIQAEELRTIISIKDMPDHLLDAFTSIEDERFEEHKGVDPYGIGAAIYDNLSSGGTRGASTITQQLARNLYLSNDVKISRKLKEAYLALQIEKVLSKDQILEAYLNRSYFGQNAYGVQEAAQTYFSKDAKDLTIAESAIIAGIVKSTVQFQPYYRVKPSDFDSEKHYEVGQIDVLGERMIVVYNEDSVNRQKIVLSKMLELEKINQNEYDQALNQDMKISLNPGIKQPYDITSYFTDYVKTQVVESLVSKLGYSREEADDLLFTGGLSIYATIDLDMQQEIETIYDNFVDILVGNTGSPNLINWRLSNSNIIDGSGKTVFFAKSNILTEDYNLVIDSGNFEVGDNGLRLTTSMLTPYPAHIDVGDYYILDENNNLVTHTVGSLTVPENQFSVEEATIIISQTYLDENPGFYKIENDTLYISDDYFYIEKNGVIQPQSATVVMDYRTGHIKSVVGGRDAEGTRILNRATDSARQPGSVIKPLSVYLPALDNGYNAGTGIIDQPLEINGWKPSNAYAGYRGIESLRKSVEISINTNAVQTLQDIGIETSMTYLERMGIINSENPAKDNFVTREENAENNDEVPASLSLGGMSRGLSPLEVTAAYGAIANDGVYVEPIAFTKIVDRHGNVLLENIPKETTVVSPQIAYIMKDILRTTVTNGLSSRASIGNMAVAGKTGTTQREADIWYAGFTPYYVSATWIGNDSPSLTIGRGAHTSGSQTAARFWQHINAAIHEGLETISSFQRPDGITSASVCIASGKLATSTCSYDSRNLVRSEIFAVGTVPNEYCDAHTTVEVCAETGLLATEYCPETQTRSFIQGGDSDDSSNEKGHYAPREYCDVHTEERSIVDDIIDTLFPPDEDDNNGNEDPPAPGNGNGDGTGNEEPPATGDENGNGNGNGNGD